MERRVLVTGAGSGIGFATARDLARSGFSVIGLVHDEDGEEELARQARADRLSIEALTCDLADPAARRDRFTDLALYALVNNAGYMNAGAVRDVDLGAARRQFEVMLVAPIDIVQQVLPHMMRTGQGKIVNVTSSAVHSATPLSGWYQAVKAAARELNDALRLELFGSGVDVVDVEPGAFRTGIWRRAESELDHCRERSRNPAQYTRVLRHLQELERRAGDPQDVAMAIKEILTTGRPSAHRRVGGGSLLLRGLAEAVPDRIADHVVARAFSD